MEVQPHGFPVSIKCAHVSICNEPTDIILSTYSDAAVLMVSQLGTVGTVLSVRQDATFEGKTTFTTATLVGKRNEPMLTVAARQLVEAAHNKGNTSPLICCLSVKQHTPECIKQLLAAVQQHGIL